MSGNRFSKEEALGYEISLNPSSRTPPTPIIESPDRIDRIAIDRDSYQNQTPPDVRSGGFELVVKG
jgi:hypothetical protein